MHHSNIEMDVSNVLSLREAYISTHVIILKKKKKSASVNEVTPEPSSQPPCLCRDVTSTGYVLDPARRDQLQQRELL